MERQTQRRQGKGARWRTSLAGLLVLAGAVPQMAVAQATAPLSGTWMPTGSMTLARAFHTATLLPDGQVLVAGGITPQSDTPSAELYTPATGMFTATGSLSWGREQGAATLLHTGQALVVGGALGQAALDSTDLYDPATGAFSAMQGMGIGRVDFTATTLRDGRVLVTGGCNGTFLACSTTLSSAQLYDPRTGVWSYTGSMSVNRQYHTATLLPTGEVLVVGGAPCSACLANSSADLYNPATGAFVPTGALHAARALHTATLLPTGEVLVAGGCAGVNSNACGGSPTLASAELYNPATGTWTMTDSLPAPRMGQTATLLPSGEVLLAGGAHCIPIGFCLALASAELYNPATGRWTATAPMSRPRELFTATALPDGRVLVAGGCSFIAISGVCPAPPSKGSFTASAELYTP